MTQYISNNFRTSAIAPPDSVRSACERKLFNYYLSALTNVIIFIIFWNKHQREIEKLIVVL